MINYFRQPASNLPESQSPLNHPFINHQPHYISPKLTQVIIRSWSGINLWPEDLPIWGIKYPGVL